MRPVSLTVTRVSALLLILDVGACIAMTDVCPPQGSTTSGQIASSGGQVVVVPSRPMRALGAEFRGGSNVTVHVAPWRRSDGKRGAIVHVTGELVKESVVGGARVAGTVTIGQGQGASTTKPQLVNATDIKGGRITFGSGTIDLTPGMKLSGRVDLDRGSLEITSPDPLRALGLDFDAGAVKLEQRGAEVVIAGPLARPQEISGVLVSKQIRVQLGGKVPVFEEATLAGLTPLKRLGLPDGDAPPGTVVRGAALVGPGPFTVCGISLVPPANATGLVFQPEPGSNVAVQGALVGADVDVGGVFMSGAVTLRFAAGSCKRTGVAGVLTRASRHLGLDLAAHSAFSVREFEGAPLVQGTLATPAIVEGLPVTGMVLVRDAGGHATIVNATLARAAGFEAWELPALTKLQRFTHGWQFETPKGQAARARDAYLGNRLDAVVLARRDERATALTFARPQPIHGVAMTSVQLDHASGCLEGGVISTQHHGMFEIPKEGGAMLCRGALVKARGTYAVPSLRVARWYATHAIAGDPTSPPAGDDAAPAANSTGFWLQINSLCQGATGVPAPPPPRRWIVVDAKGQPMSRADEAALTARATKPGKPCPETACCPP